MEKKKLQIELNNRTYNNEMVYVAVSLRGGYAIRNYVVNGTNQFVSNCAFYNILFNYYKIVDKNDFLHFDVQRAVSTISFCKKKSELIPAVESVIHTLFDHKYDLENFEEAKQTAIEAFTVQYKDGEFRSKYKGHEFSDLNKQFSLKQLIEDIENLTYNEFVENANTLIIPSNVCIYIAGEIIDLDFTTIALENYKDQFSNMICIAGPGYDSYLRQEAHITNIAREDHNLIIESIDFLNGEITNFTKQLIVEMFAELIPIQEVDIWVDSLDASIMFDSDLLRSYKNILSFDSGKTYEIAKKKLLNKYALLLENNPESFVIRSANLMTIGIYIDQYLSFLDKCSYELFNEIYEKANCKITEAQVVLRKESR